MVLLSAKNTWQELVLPDLSASVDGYVAQLIVGLFLHPVEISRRVGILVGQVVHPRVNRGLVISSTS